MRRTAWPRSLALSLGVAGACLAADWYQWRGPERNGLASDSPALIDALPQGGPKRVWQSAKVPGAGTGGYGSVTVAGGRAYVYANSKYYEPFPTRTLTPKGLETLGWSADMPEGLRDKLDAARTSPERTALGKQQVRNWVRDWVKKNVPRAARKFHGLCYRRLTEGNRAVPLPALVKLSTVLDRTFASQKELDAWFAQSGIEAKWKRKVMRVIPTRKNLARDEIFCLNAGNGEIAWKQRLPGKYVGHACSSTPCVVNGRCYVQGSTNEVYCLDAATGEVVWRARTKARAGATLGSSFVVQDGVAVLLAGALTGFDANTGKELWTERKVRGNGASAAYWRTGGNTYLVCNGSRETFCFEPKTGKVLWKALGGGQSTPAIVGDRMAVFSGNRRAGLVAYKLSIEGAQKLWSIPFTDRGSSPVIHDGHVYAIGGRNKGRAACVALETGKVAWDTKLPNTEVASPILADGKLWVLVGMGSRPALYVIRATPEKYTLLGQAKTSAVICTSPALADGRMWLRLPAAVACYDLRK